jgi:hypothetical protein
MVPVIPGAPAVRIGEPMLTTILMMIAAVIRPTHECQETVAAVIGRGVR